MDEDHRDAVMSDRLMRERMRERVAAGQRERSARRKVVLVATCFAAGAIASWTLWVFTRATTLDAPWRNAVPFVTITMAAAVMATLRYLQPAAAPRRKPATRDYVDHQLAILARHLGASREVTMPTEDREQAIAQLKAELRDSLANQLFEDIKAELRVEAPLRAVETKLAQMERRIEREIVDLGRRGNVNLVLGMVTTMIGLLVLGYAVVSSPAATTAADLVLHFLPRLSFAVLIEVFAYFFLRLYKQSLTEIKYFQNELTNIESRSVATHLAIHSSDSALVAEMARTLSTTERNFVLQSGQTTVELERERIAQKNNEKLLGVLDHAVKSQTAK